MGADARPATTGGPSPSLGDEQAAASPAPAPAPASAASWPVPPSQTVLALRDVAEGARAFRPWGMLGWRDVRQRYRRPPELVRAPLLGQAPGLVSWLAASGITLGGWLVTLAMYRRYRWRIAYWV